MFATYFFNFRIVVELATSDFFKFVSKVIAIALAVYV